MKLRLSIDTILLAAALLAVAPAGLLHASEAASDTASTDVPRLIDPSSPPPSERQTGTTASPHVEFTESASGGRSWSAVRHIVVAAKALGVCAIGARRSPWAARTGGERSGG